jgi:hypothetical protein
MSEKRIEGRMNEERDQRVRERAYGIWESQGRPDGRHDEHWQEAERELAGEETLPPHPVQPKANRAS